MDTIKQLFAKLISGFLFGVGFIFAAGLLGGYAISHITSTARESSGISNDYSEVGAASEIDDLFKEYDETALLSAEVKTERISNGSFTLLGVLSNNGQYSWQMTKLKAELYDKNGQFIEQCEEYVSQIIRPGEKVNFKLSCRSNSCNTLELNSYHSYILSIADARYLRERS